MGKMVFGLTAAYLFLIFFLDINSVTIKIHHPRGYFWTAVLIKLEKEFSTMPYQSMWTRKLAAKGRFMSPSSMHPSEWFEVIFPDCIPSEAILTEVNSEKKPMITPEDGLDDLSQAPALNWPFETSFSPIRCGEPGKRYAWMEGYMYCAHSVLPQPFKTCLLPAVKLPAKKPQGVIHVLQRLHSHQQSKQENYVSKRKTEKAMHFKMLRSSLSMQPNTLYFAFLIIFNNNILRKTNPWSQVPFQKCFDPWSMRSWY